MTTDIATGIITMVGASALGALLFIVFAKFVSILNIIEGFINKESTNDDKTC